MVGRYEGKRRGKASGFPTDIANYNSIAVGNNQFNSNYRRLGLLSACAYKR